MIQKWPLRALQWRPYPRVGPTLFTENQYPPIQHWDLHGGIGLHRVYRHLGAWERASRRIGSFDDLQRYVGSRERVCTSCLDSPRLSRPDAQGRAIPVQYQYKTCRVPNKRYSARCSCFNASAAAYMYVNVQNCTAACYSHFTVRGHLTNPLEAPALTLQHFLVQ
jgi:hypothetical protein